SKKNSSMRKTFGKYLLTWKQGTQTSALFMVPIYTEQKPWKLSQKLTNHYLNLSSIRLLSSPPVRIPQWLKHLLLTWKVIQYKLFWKRTDLKYKALFVVDINCEVTAGHKYVHFSPSGIAPGGCFPRARPQPPCPGKGYADVVRKGRF